MAAAGAEGLMAYLRTPVPGVWRDKMQPNGDFIDEPAPASSFYHIVCAIVEFDRAVSAAS
jgi:mannose-6-phosphate isomerase